MSDIIDFSLGLLNNTLSFYLCRAYPHVVAYLHSYFLVRLSDIENEQDNVLKGKTFCSVLGYAIAFR